MYKIKSIRHDEIQNNQYRFGNNYPSYVITQKNQAIAYIQFKINEDRVMNLEMIEVIHKEQHHGTNIIKWLFEHFNLQSIKGVSLREERAYYFWLSLGASFEFIDEEGFSVSELIRHGIEAPFVLTAG